jgi:hypothetical protein
MRNGSWLGLVAAVAISGLALAPTGCSSVGTPGDDGGAQGGSSGHAGSGGTPGTDPGATCQSLVDDYNAAFAEARTCSPLLTVVQCTQLASASLQCPGCRIHVNDTTRLDAIRAEFDARTDCPRVPCPAILCIDPGTSGACVANDSGSAGSCIDAR